METDLDDGPPPHRVDCTDVDVSCMFSSTLTHLDRRITSLRADLLPRTIAEAVMDAAQSNRKGVSGQERERHLIDALEWFDEHGYVRSAHQRVLHEHFRRACTSLLYGDEYKGNVERVMQENNWTEITQEVIAQTPRRFGKTMCTAMFAVALATVLNNARISIYSTADVTATQMLALIRKFFVAMGAKARFDVSLDNMNDLKFFPKGCREDERWIRSYTSNENMSNLPSPFFHLSVFSAS